MASRCAGGDPRGVPSSPLIAGAALPKGGGIPPDVYAYCSGSGVRFFCKFTRRLCNVPSQRSRFARTRRRTREGTPSSNSAVAAVAGGRSALHPRRLRSANANASDRSSASDIAGHRRSPTRAVHGFVCGVIPKTALSFWRLDVVHRRYDLLF